MAVDDAYSRYVVGLKPAMYLRFRSVVVGQTAAQNEVSDNPVLFSGALGASHIGANALPPALVGGGATSLQFRSSLFAWIGGYPGTGSINTQACRVPNSQAMSLNFWYRNPSSPGAVNQRLIGLAMAEQWTAGSSAGLSVFGWNSADNGLLEVPFKKHSTLLGTSNMADVGLSNTWRYLSNLSNNTVNTVHMATITFDVGRIAQYRDGELMRDFVWNPDDYRVLTGASTHGGRSTLGCGVTYGNTRFEYSTADMSEYSSHYKVLSEREIRELYSLGANGIYTREIAGTVTDGVGMGIARLVRAHSQTTGKFLNETTSASDGTFTLDVPDTGEAMYLVAFDDITTDPDYNASIQANVVAT